MYVKADVVAYVVRKENVESLCSVGLCISQGYQQELVAGTLPDMTKPN